MSYPSLTIIIPVYNAEKRVGPCLESLFSQDYPKDKFQVFLIDGRSQDKTIEIAKRLGAKIIDNPLKIEERAKPIGIKKSKSDILCFLDDDNQAPHKKWLKNMVEPFKDPKIIGTETYTYTYRKKDDMITKYNALIGGDDPIASYLGYNDRFCYFTNQWTGMARKEKDQGNYIKVKLQKDQIPAMGSNGFFVRRKVLKKIKFNPFIHPLIIHDLVGNGHTTFAKVKDGILHIQDGSIKTFFRKKIRRIKRRTSGEIKWGYNFNITKKRLIKLVLYQLSIILPIKDAVLGYIRKPSYVWLFHPIASISLIFIYGFYNIKSIFQKNPKKNNT